MARWTSEALDTLAAADELLLASERADGTLRRPVTIWVVRLGDDLYVRSVNGRGAAWFQGALERHAAQVRAEDVVTHVRLVETDDHTDELDAAYRAKYRRYAQSIVESIVTPTARAATLALVPQE